MSSSVWCRGSWLICTQWWPQLQQKHFKWIIAANASQRPDAQKPFMSAVYPNLQKPWRCQVFAKSLLLANYKIIWESMLVHKHSIWFERNCSHCAKATVNVQNLVKWRAGFYHGYMSKSPNISGKSEAQRLHRKQMDEAIVKVWSPYSQAAPLVLVTLKLSGWRWSSKGSLSDSYQKACSLLSQKAATASSAACFGSISCRVSFLMHTWRDLAGIEPANLPR